VLRSQQAADARPGAHGRPATPAGSAEEAARQALDNGDEHIIKFTETALQAERRGFAAGRAAAAHALQIIPADG
jgi:hypothetical protein